MKHLDEFARIPLGVLPTPLYKLETLSRELGHDLYIKRDDMTGVGLGGNKVRKLEFLLADALAQGADVVLTTGAAQSNHAMLTAACAARFGLKTILVLKKRGVLEGGNLILDDIYGAEVRFVDSDERAEVVREIEGIMEALRREGHKPYFIPTGGSVPLGCLGYVNCTREIAAQAEALGVRFGAIVSATGSGGTYAGLTLGAKKFLPGARSVGIGVSDGDFAATTLALMEETCTIWADAVPATADDVHIVYYYGDGYAIPSAEGSAAVRRLARAEGILVDPVYSGKALAGLFHLLEEGYFAPDEPILFVHTGGAGALFAVDLVKE